MKRNHAAKLLLIALTASAALFSAAPLFSAGTREPVLESSQFFALGTTCTVSIYDNVGIYDSSVEEQFAEIEDIVNGIEGRMSVNIDDSEVSAVNAAAGLNPVEVSPDVYKVISAGIRFSDISGGAFDISIGPLVQLWDIGGSGNTVPPQEKIDLALSLADYSMVELLPAAQVSSDSIYLPVTGMALEPGGIAKGFAADAAADYLRSEAVESALINFGGNVLAFGTKPDGSPWRIGIQNPDSSRGDYIGIASVSDKAVVTSGKYERFFIAENGVRYHHILSTETGFPVENGIEQVSIIASESMTADAMSTSVFSLGLEAGLQLAERMEELEAIIVTETGAVYTTSGLKDVFRLTDGSYHMADTEALP